MLTRVVDPDGDFVPLSEMKAHLRVDFDDEDAYISSLMRAAISHLDGPRGILGRCIQPQVWRLDLADGLNSTPLRLPLPGIGDIVAFRQGDDGSEVEALVSVSRRGPWAYVTGAGEVSAIQFTVSTPVDCWPAIEMAVKLLVGHWYENRETVVVAASATEMPMSVVRLLSPLKVRWVG